MGGGLIGFKDFTEKEIQMIIIQIASVKSINLWKSVIQTNYDIVKAHGGELKVETKEKEGSEFMIVLPVD
jgi:K+-sensing histidine kinase KdpD